MTGDVVGWVVTGVIAVTLAAFAGFVVASGRYPDERPAVPTFDRAGRPLEERPNPGPEIAPGRAGDPFGHREA